MKLAYITAIKLIYLFLFIKKHKFKLRLDSYIFYNDTFNGEASLGIISLSFVYSCDDVPDDGCTAETCCTNK